MKGLAVKAVSVILDYDGSFDQDLISQVLSAVEKTGLYDKVGGQNLDIYIFIFINIFRKRILHKFLPLL